MEKTSPCRAEAPGAEIPSAGAGKTLRHALKRLIPRRCILEAMRYRKLNREERRVYLKVRILDVLGVRRYGRKKVLGTERSFLFVCFGNIMRSPMCEALMKRALLQFPGTEVVVTSAGLSAAPGREAHAWSISSAEKFGISLRNHRARLLTQEMVDQADVVFAMDYENLVTLLCRYPRAQRKLVMLSIYAPDGSLAEIRDPFYADEAGTTCCFQMLGSCIENLVADLGPHLAPTGGLQRPTSSTFTTRTPYSGGVPH